MKLRIFNLLVALLLSHVSFSQNIDRDTFLIKDIDIAAKVILEKRQSALKTLAPLKYIPIATSTIDKKILDYRAVNNINDAMQYATGVRSNVNYGGFQTFRFRGFGSPIIMVDGARDERMNWSNSAPVTDLTSVERIEFLKGPASVMYGHSAVGGILNIVRKQPTATTKGNAQMSYGSWNTKHTEVGAGGAINSKLNYRFDAAYNNSEGWRGNATNGANVYLALDYQLSDKDVLKFKTGGNDDFYATEAGLPALQHNIYDANTDKQTYKMGDLPAGIKREQRYNDPNDFLNHQNYNVSVAWAHEINHKSKFETSLSYNNDDIDYFSTEELSYLTSSAPIYKHYYMNGADKQYICLDTLQRTFPLRFAHETKTLQYNADYYTQFNTGRLNHNVLLGYSFTNVDRTSYTGYKVGDDVSGAGLFAKVSVVNPVLNQGNLNTKFSRATPANDQSHGIYFQDLIDISKAFKLMLGGRYDYFNYTHQTADVTEGRNYENASKAQSIKNNAFTYRAGLVYLPSEDVSLYVSASNFFKPRRDVFNPDYVYINADGERFYPAEGEELYKPEQGYQLEGGAKWQLNKVLSFNASTYYIIKKNIVEYLGQTDDALQQRIYGQVGVVDSKGLELDATAYPAKGLFINAGYSFNQTKYREFADNPYLTQSSTEGNTLVQAPENQFFAWINYTVQNGTFKGLSLGTGTHYTDKVFTNSANTFVLPAYWVSDATISYLYKNMTVRFNVKNLTDENYYDNTVYANQYIPGMGRSFTTSITLNF